MGRDDFFLLNSQKKWRKFGCFFDSGDVIEFGIADFDVLRNCIVCNP